MRVRDVVPNSPVVMSRLRAGCTHGRLSGVAWFLRFHQKRYSAASLLEEQGALQVRLRWHFIIKHYQLKQHLTRCNMPNNSLTSLADVASERNPVYVAPDGMGFVLALLIFTHGFMAKAKSQRGA